MKYFTLLIAFLLFSCGKKEDVLLPKSNVTIVKDVQDLSPVYIFFKTQGKDTTADALNGTIVLNTVALTKGAKILRVHDVKEAVECVTLFNKMSLSNTLV